MKPFRCKHPVLDHSDTSLGEVWVRHTHAHVQTQILLSHTHILSYTYITYKLNRTLFLICLLPLFLFLSFS